MNDALYGQLPFFDKTDFRNAHKGFIAPLPAAVIKDEKAPLSGTPEIRFYQRRAKAPDTVNPSLWRQAQLNNIGGLFEVTEGVYQIRNLDLSNMTIIEGKEGSRLSIRWCLRKRPKRAWIFTFNIVANARLLPLFIPIVMSIIMAACVAWSMKRE